MRSSPSTVAACRANGWGVHTHLAEVREELTESRTRWGMSTIQHGDRKGLLDQTVIAGHCIWCAEADIGLLASRDVTVSHNPVANMILASGVCPVPACAARASRWASAPTARRRTTTRTCSAS